MHKTIQVVTQVRNLRQLINTVGSMVKKAGAEPLNSQDMVVFKEAQQQIDDLFKICLDLSVFSPQVHKLIEEAQVTLNPVKEKSFAVIKNQANSKMNLLIIDQFILEAQDSLGKVQLVLAANSDLTFERIYKERFIPLSVGIVLSLIFLVFALWMGIRLKKKIERPIQNLILATQQIADGNLKARSDIFDADEIGLLANAFNMMAANLDQSTVSKAYLESILESMLNCVFVLNVDNTILTVNRLSVTTFGYAKDELIGLSVYKILHQISQQDFKILKNNTSFETFAFSKNNLSFPAFVSIASLDESAGVPSNLRVCVIKDITDIKKLENEIKERNLALSLTNQELEAFSYSVSHDLRAPLRVIDGFSQALLEDAKDNLNPEGKMHLERIRAGVQRMGHLIDAVLNLSRLSRTSMDLVPLDLTSLAKTIVNDLRTLEPQRNVDFIIHDGLTAMGDNILIKITLENLIGNAWKYTRKKSLAQIEFGLQDRNGLDVFYIKDNGVGFDMTYAKKLFTPFQRLHSAQDFPGTGVGLASVKRIIHRHRGIIWAESELNRGTTFYFTLPQA